MKYFSKSTSFLCAVFVLLLSTNLLGVYLFSIGFFPIKESFSGFSTHGDFPQTEGPEGTVVPAKYDRLVLMVIDAFRSDFLFEQQSEMKFVKSQLVEGDARGFISRAHAPTVTLPRIKALVSGNIPSFADFIMNFNSKEIKDDNLLDQFINSGKKISFYGDDTWLKLFPRQFNRFEGVSSFFVSDYTEVDNNVTRNIEPELSTQDWSIVVLHYLGLDHIGHLEGPHSQKMGPKIQEMDSIIKYLHDEIERQDFERGTSTLLVVCSDHGMNEVGNHGGTSTGETSAIMLFFSSLLGHNLEFDSVKTVAQVDMTPTLALLFGLPIPKNSMGTLIPALFANYTAEQYLRALELNCLQRIQLMKANSRFWANGAPTTRSLKEVMVMFEEAQQLHASWAATPIKHSHFESQAAELYVEFMHKLYEEFAEALTSYDDYALVLGILMITVSAVGFIIFVWAFVCQFMSQVSRILGAPIFWLIFALLTSASLFIHFQVYCPHFGSILCSTDNSWFVYVCLCFSASTALVVCTIAFTYTQATALKTGASILSYFLLFGTILHLVSMFASSLVEEEHQTWYFLMTTILVLAFTTSFYSQKSGAWGALLTLVCFRCLRYWNQTGIKWMDNLPNESTIDFGRWLNSPQYLQRIIRFCVSGIACVLPCIYAGRFADSEKMLIGKVTSAVFRNSINFCGISIFVYKFNLFPFPAIWMARFVYLCLGVAMFVAIGYPFWKGQKRVPDTAIQHQPTLNELIMTYAKVTPVLILFAYMMLLLLLAKVHNMFIFVLLGVAAHYLPSYTKSSTNYYTRVLEVVAISHWMGQTAYFGFGNSNSLSTIDISGAYTGISGYHETLVGTLVFIIGYSGPIFFSMAALAIVARSYHTEHVEKDSHTYEKMATSYIFVCFCFAVIRSLQLLVFSVVTMIMKHHLFVWSVFSPKYIYEIFADGYLLFICLLSFFLFVHVSLIGLMLDRRRNSKQNKVV